MIFMRVVTLRAASDVGEHVMTWVMHKQEVMA